MMSVIIKENGVYKLLCKGADSSILGRLAKRDQPFLAATTERLNEYSKLGLRTLCMAIRVLSEEEVNQIRQKLLGLSVAGKERDNLMGRQTPHLRCTSRGGREGLVVAGLLGCRRSTARPST